MTRAREASADTIQQIVEEAETMIDRDFELEADDKENAQRQFKINTKDTHRADKKNKTKQKSEQVKKRNNEHVTKKHLRTRLKEFTWIYFRVIPPSSASILK